MSINEPSITRGAQPLDSPEALAIEARTRGWEAGRTVDVVGMAPTEVIPVYFVDAPPRGSVKLSPVEFAHPSHELSFVWWRNTWCVVNRRFRKIFESLDARLGAGETGLVWRRYNT